MNRRKTVRRAIIFCVSLIMVLQTLYIPGAFAEEKGKSVTILFTHDMHDNLLPLKTLEGGKIVSIGGYARLMSAIKAQREKDPEAVLVDAGDFSMGTPFQTIFQTDAPELRMLGAMGYDAVTLGNHEYDYRPAGLAGSLTAAKNSKDQVPLILQSNVSFPTDASGKMSEDLAELKKAMADYGVKDYTVIERNGVKIGIFGLMGKESASMAPMSGVTFPDEVKEAKRVVKLLKDQEKVDLILCLSHSGTKPSQSSSEDEILAKKVPEINVIISGHTHSRLSKPIIIGNTIIGSAEDYGKYLGVIKLSGNQGNGWRLENYELVQINDTLNEDSNIKDKIDYFKGIVQKKYFDSFSLNYDEVVAQSQIQFQTPEQIYGIHGEATIGDLISDAYIYSVKKADGDNYTPVTAAIVPCGTIRNTIFQGDITTADAFSISSLGIGADGMPGYPLISVYLTGKELKTVCEVDASIAPIMGDAQLYMSGVSYTFNPNRLIFNKVTKAYINGSDNKEEKIDDKKLYRVVCNLYSAQMLSVVGEKSYGLMSVVPKTKDGKKITDFEAEIIYDSKNGSKKELKEWYAVVQYLQSFDQADGIAQVPEYYRTAHERKVIDHSKNIIDLVRYPNHIALIVSIVVTVIIILLILVVVKIIKRIRRGKAFRTKNLRRK